MRFVFPPSVHEDWRNMDNGVAALQKKSRKPFAETRAILKTEVWRQHFFCRYRLHRFGERTKVFLIIADRDFKQLFPKWRDANRRVGKSCLKSRSAIIKKT